MTRRAFLVVLGLLLALPAHAAEPTPSPNTVAVLYFDVAGGDASLAILRKGMAQMLIADLADLPTAAIVEREALQAVLTEQKLDRDLKMAPGTSARVGKLLGARYLVLGTLFSLQDRLAVTTKVVDVQTGVVVKGVSRDGKLDDFLAIEQGLASGLREAIARLPTPPAPVTAAPRAAPVRERPKPPSRLPLASAVRYAKALDLHDHGRNADARTEVKAVVAEHPDFALAAADLQKFMR
jgi:TolB-like protein